MITSNVAFYPCASIRETDAFYSGLIGLKTVFSRGNSRIYSAVSGHFGFVEYPEQKPASGRLCLSLNCDSNESVDIEYERILSAGGQLLGRPEMHSVFPVYSFFIQDPNGYLVEFQKIVGVDM